MARRVTANRIFSASATEVVASTTVDSNGNFIVAPATNEAAITSLIDSNYVAARAPGGVDSNAITSLIDSDYVAARAPAGGGGGAAVITYTYDGILSNNIGSKRRYISSTSTLATADLYVITPSSGSAINLRINKNGSSAGTVTIDSGQTSSINNALNISLAQNDYLTVDITQVGSVTPGSNLYMNLKFS